MKSGPAWASELNVQERTRPTKKMGRRMPRRGEVLALIDHNWSVMIITRVCNTRNRVQIEMSALGQHLRCHNITSDGADLILPSGAASPIRRDAAKGSHSLCSSAWQAEPTRASRY